LLYGLLMEVAALRNLIFTFQQTVNSIAGHAFVVVASSIFKDIGGATRLGEGFRKYISKNVTVVSLSNALQRSEHEGVHAESKR
jgi:hypothetical protein